MYETDTNGVTQGILELTYEHQGKEHRVAVSPTGVLLDFGDFCFELPDFEELISGCTSVHKHADPSAEERAWGALLLAAADAAARLRDQIDANATLAGLVRASWEAHARLRMAGID